MINHAQLNAMRLEADELHFKIVKLIKFRHSEVWKTLDGIEKELLRSQLNFMRGYFDDLCSRIKLYERRLKEKKGAEENDKT